MSDNARDDEPSFEGHGGSQEHRTVGPHRAWCHGCGEWCYPSSACRCCESVMPRRLVCPYCGGDIEAELTYTGLSFSEHRDLTGYECEDYQCDARWTSRGDVERLPKGLRESVK